MFRSLGMRGVCGADLDTGMAVARTNTTNSELSIPKIKQKHNHTDWLKIKVL